MKKTLAFTTMILAGVTSAFAVDTLPQESPTFSRRVRNLGMGNVGVSITGTTESSAFYNPAGLNDITQSEIRFMTITSEIAKNSTDLINDVKDLKDDIDGASNDADKVRVLNDFIQQRSGEFQHLRLGIELLSYTQHNFAAGLNFDETIDLSFRDQSFPHFDMRNIGDANAYVAFSTDFWDKLLQLGMTFRPTMRFALNEKDQQITYADATTENANGDPIIKDQFENILDDRQFVIPVDFGIKSNLGFDFWKDSTAYDVLQPAIGFTWENIGSPSFAPLPTSTQTANAGISISPKLWRLKNTFAVEMRELNRSRPMLTKLHVGGEVKLPWVLAVRGGVAQGYWTGGLSLDLVFVRIDGAVYHEEVGYYNREDGNRRYAVSFGFKI